MIIKNNPLHNPSGPEKPYFINDNKEEFYDIDKAVFSFRKMLKSMKLTLKQAIYIFCFNNRIAYEDTTRINFSRVKTFLLYIHNQLNLRTQLYSGYFKK